MSETNHDHQENGFRSGVALPETVRVSAYRRSDYSLFCCIPAEPNYASPDKIIVPNQISKLRLYILRSSYPWPYPQLQRSKIRNRAPKAVDSHQPHHDSMCFSSDILSPTVVTFLVHFLRLKTSSHDSLKNIYQPVPSYLWNLV